MKLGRLITTEGVEISVEISQLRELTDYLSRWETHERFAASAGEPDDGPSLVDPENYERVIQAAYFAKQARARQARA
jgi:hypothetical protein